MRDDVQPFPIPAQHARPHLEFLVHADLAPEIAAHAPEVYAQPFGARVAGFAVEVAGGGDETRGEETG